MTRRKFSSIGITLSVISLIICGVASLLPVKSGIRIPVHTAEGKMGYINDSGKMILAAEWDEATPFGPNGKGFVRSDRMVWRFRFKPTKMFSRWPIYRFRENKFLEIDRQGNTEPVEIFSYLSRYPEVPKPDEYGMALKRDHAGYKWVLANGSDAFPGIWENAKDFNSKDPAAVYENGRWGFINRKGETIIPFEWNDTRGFDGRGRACVTANNKSGAIDPAGKLVIPLYFNYLDGFDEKGMSAAQLDSGSGFIDLNGKIVIPFRYAHVSSFDRLGNAKVLMRNDQDELRFGWIDRSGRQIIPCIYHEWLPSWTSDFTDHELLPVCDSKGSGLIDRNGKIIIPTGSAALKHIEDPSAPGKFWIVSIPNGHIGKRSTFIPACYDQSGKLIWQGNTWSRKAIAGLGLLSAAAATGVLAIAKFRLKTENSQ